MSITTPRTPALPGVEDSAEMALAELAAVCDNRTLELHLFVTEKCNFRCVYCYEDFAVGRMRPDVVAGVKALIRTRAPRLDTLNLSFFGGEPLLAKALVLELAAEAQALCGQHGGRFLGGMTTNGWYLDAASLEALCGVGVNAFQITLDGPAPLHDQSRIRIDGRGSFERIYGNLRAARASMLSFSITLRLHLRPDTEDLIHDWLPELRRDLLDDSRFSILIKAVEHLGGPNDADVQVYPDRTSKVDALGRAYAALGLPLRPPGGDILSRACYACRPNAWVIRANGALARCTVALDDDRNRIGQLRADGSLDIDQTKLTPWFRPLASLDPGALACPITAL